MLKAFCHEYVIPNDAIDFFVTVTLRDIDED